ncbi:hypothetical protein [Spiroplasma citri]|uniref:hypothetical protein n=1 Tax=Spiroplasma citri TaxID=2133 RepID=UPI00148B1DDF|nr:hypothetical protein [Spiroplasma citri]QJU62306.1 hypothetical protein HHA36_08370 [Spiroplasma citri]
MEKWRLEKYTIINCSKTNYIYRKEILEKCFNSPHIQEIYHIFLKEELKKNRKRDLIISFLFVYLTNNFNDGIITTNKLCF